MTFSENTRGALLMMASMAAFTFGDTCVKALSGDMPLSQILVIRGVLASIAIFLLAQAMGQLRLRLPRKDLILVLLRCFGEVGAAYFFLQALFHLPLANVTALLQMLPLTVTLGGALIFGENVGWRRWSAIAIGFVGMLLIVQPGTDGFNLYTVYGLLAVLFVTIRDLSTRRLSPIVPSLTVTLWASITVLIFALFLALSEDWVPLTGENLPLLLGSSLFIIGGYSFSVFVMRVGDVSFTAPFRYTGLLWALLLGWLIFGDWPDNVTLLGGAIVVATGLYTLFRQGKHQAEKTRRS
ncbi:MAG: DMT family transporter [Pelagimonas sp.]|jgi:S-adenosylmethionine uptake transporter|nr:DMT family transporter [Pelagimonas sp.]